MAISRVPELAADLVRSGVDVIVQDSTYGTVDTMRLTSTIPIVMALVVDPTVPQSVIDAAMEREVKPPFQSRERGRRVCGAAQELSRHEGHRRPLCRRAARARCRWSRWRWRAPPSRAGGAAPGLHVGTAGRLNGVDAEAYAISANIARRHMTAGQRAMVVAKMYPERNTRGKKSSLREDFPMVSRTLSL
jgi:hypothetical protein